MKTKIIAELGNSHEGSVGIAKSLIDMAFQAGADAVKFQMHIAQFESTVDEPFRIKFSSQDKSRLEYWERVSFSLENWYFLKEYCDEIGLEFICTPFSIEAAKLLEENLHVMTFKIGSGDAANWPLLDYVLSTGKTTLISTGLLSMREIESLANWILGKEYKNAVILHCVSQYPAPLEKISFPVLESIRLLHPRVGYSDHSGNLNVAKLALSIENLEVLEIHLTPHKLFFGPDVSSSLTPEEIGQLVQFRNTVNELRSHFLTKEELFLETNETRRIFRKGLFACRDLNSGEFLSDEMFVLRKPVTGIDSVDMHKVLGSRIRTYIKEGQPIQWEDLEIDGRDA